MTRSSFGKPLTCLVAVLVAANPALAHLNLHVPHAAIEYNAEQSVSLHASAEPFSKTTPILLHDMEPGDATYWLAGSATELTTLRGYAHVGGAGQTLQDASANVTLIQIWSWLDTNGNGVADSDDTTTQWTKLVELTPSTGGGDGSGGYVVGHAVPWPMPAIHTSTWQGNLLQLGKKILLKPGQSRLLLIRVVDVSGNTSLMTELAGLEQWDNGLADGIGSDVVEDRYLDSNGNTPGYEDGRIEDEDVVWLYVPRLK